MDPPITESHSPPPPCSSSNPQSGEDNNKDDGDVDGDADPTGPIVAAIREELQKFQRPHPGAASLAGITVINDPELVNKNDDEEEEKEGGGGGGPGKDGTN